MLNLLATLLAFSFTGAPFDGRVVEIVDQGVAVSVSPKQKGQCHAVAPGDWDFLSATDAGDAADLIRADRRSYAGWMIRGVNSQMRPYYGDAYADPKTSSRYVVGLVGKAVGDGGPYSFVGQPVQLGAGFVSQELESSDYRAMIVYRLYPAPAMSSPGSYIISLRIAIAPKAGGDRELHLATGISVGLQCVTQFVPPKNGDVPIPRPGDAFDRRSSGESGELTDYNAQLGTQYAHSPSTGQNYLLDRAAAWNDHGPDGPGFYRQVGNSYEKLVPGMQ